jgi:predicted transcriptional regulator
MSLKKDATMMSFRLSDYLREELSRTADKMDITDSELVRIAIISALAKFARRIAT